MLRMVQQGCGRWIPALILGHLLALPPFVWTQSSAPIVHGACLLELTKTGCWPLPMDASPFFEDPNACELPGWGCLHLISPGDTSQTQSASPTKAGASPGLLFP